MSVVLRFARTWPFTFGVGFSTVKTSVSDLVVQRFVEQREEIDWRRNAAFAAFGFGYLGMVQYTLYVPVFGRMFPKTAEFAAKPLAEKMRDPRGILNVFTQVVLDQAVHHPFAYFPVFYMTKEVVTTVEGKPDLGRALQRWRENFWPDLFALWQVWVPATMMNFAFSPMWLRIPVVASTSLIWTMILSTMRGAEKSEATIEGVADNTDVILLPEEHHNPVLGGHVSARTMEIFARGLARRGLLHAHKPSSEEAHLAQDDGASGSGSGSSSSGPLGTGDATSSGERKGGQPSAATQLVRRLTGDPAGDESHLCVTAQGQDRIGIVSLLTHWIYERGGNITDSKMLRMNDQFIIVMHVTAPDDDKAARLRADLLGAHHQPPPLATLEIHARDIGHHATDALHKREARLRLTGKDQPGIVFKVTQMFADLGFNIDELATDTVPSSAASTPWFLLEVFATSPDDNRKHDLDARIKQLKADLGVNVELTWTR